MGQETFLPSGGGSDGIACNTELWLYFVMATQIALNRVHSEAPSQKILSFRSGFW